MKVISLFVLFFSLSLFAEDVEQPQEESEIEAMLVELAEQGYDDKEVLESLNKKASRLPASVED